MSTCARQEELAEKWVSEVMDELVEYKERADEELRAMFGAAHAIDEMALMFTSPSWALRWISSAVRVPGVVLFNTAHDTVETRPVPSTYNVHYWFLTSPFPEGYEAGEERWRIECMYAHGGSPLHDTYKRALSGNQIALIHASFKCPDEEAYGTAVKVLGDNGYEAAQLCDSTYGRFSYWAPVEHGLADGAGVYLKPRVNLRDVEGDGE